MTRPLPYPATAADAASEPATAAPDEARALLEGSAAPGGRTRTDRRAARPIEVGLLNLLPDAALASGERQVAGLLRTAAGPLPLRLRFFTLPAIARGAAARAHMADAGYAGADALLASRLDGLFVTGTEPRAPRLADELLWPQLAAVVDWARANTRSTIWSCFAAHAAVFRLDGIPRRPLVAKCFGLFPVEAAGAPGPGGSGPVSHSRWNGLDERSLTGAGYEILTRGAVGVDSFARTVGPEGEGAGKGSRFLFFQGHPEYDAGALGREYRRDVGRFLSRASDAYPALPVAYFDAATVDALGRFAEDARRDRSPDRLARLPPLVAAFDEGRHRAYGEAVFRDWLHGLLHGSLHELAKRRS